MKEPYGFPSANIRHGCHCALLFRLPTVLTWDGCRIPGSGHTRQECGCPVQTRTLLTSISLTAQALSCSRDSVCRAMPDIPKRSAGKGLSSLTMNRTSHPLHSSHVRTVGKRNWHVGRVGIAGMLCHHFPMPYGFTYEKALWHSPSLPSGVLANFPSSVSPCYASVF